MEYFKEKYETAKNIAALVAFLGWAVVGISGLAAVFVAFSSLKAGPSALYALLPVLGVAIGGLVIVSLGQIILALVDTANNTSEILLIIKNADKSDAGPSVASEVVRHKRENTGAADDYIGKLRDSNS